MNASKENARAALAKVSTSGDPDTQFVREFLAAAERKLPTEAAYAREKGRGGKGNATARRKATTGP
jgi:hypothetical protein